MQQFLQHPPLFAMEEEEENSLVKKHRCATCTPELRFTEDPKGRGVFDLLPHDVFTKEIMMRIVLSKENPKFCPELVNISCYDALLEELISLDALNELKTLSLVSKGINALCQNPEIWKVMYNQEETHFMIPRLPANFCRQDYFKKQYLHVLDLFSDPEGEPQVPVSWILSHSSQQKPRVFKIGTKALIVWDHYCQSQEPLNFCMGNIAFQWNKGTDCPDTARSFISEKYLSDDTIDVKNRYSIKLLPFKELTIMNSDFMMSYDLDELFRDCYEQPENFENQGYEALDFYGPTNFSSEEENGKHVTFKDCGLDAVFGDLPDTPNSDPQEQPRFDIDKTRKIFGEEGHYKLKRQPK